MNPIDISVIVPCKNEEHYISTTINRIMEQDGLSNEFSCELIIVDGKSSDRTCEIVREEIQKRKNISLLENDKIITAAGWNIGIKNSHGKYICLIGAHAEIAKDYLKTCLETILEKDADNVGGPWKAKGIGYTGEAIAIAFQSPFSSAARSHDVKYNGYVDSVWGGFYKREVFDKVGLFDENFTRNEDDELNFRLAEKNIKIWQSSSIRFSYVCRDSIKNLFNQYLQYGYWKVPVLIKHKRPASIRHLAPAGFLLSYPALLLLSLLNPIFLVLSGFESVAYIALLLIASALLALQQRSNIRYLPMLPVVFFIYHFGYGYGFIRGLLNFLLLKRNKVSNRFIQLTR